MPMKNETLSVSPRTKYDNIGTKAAPSKANGYALLSSDCDRIHIHNKVVKAYKNRAAISQGDNAACSQEVDSRNLISSAANLKKSCPTPRETAKIRQAINNNAFTFAPCAAHAHLVMRFFALIPCKSLRSFAS